MKKQNRIKKWLSSETLPLLLVPAILILIYGTSLHFEWERYEDPFSLVTDLAALGLVLTLAARLLLPKESIQKTEYKIAIKLYLLLTIACYLLYLLNQIKWPNKWT